MAEDAPDRAQGQELEQEEAPKTPFDNPFFLPIMLWAFSAWFFWDAWIEPMEDHLAFNRYGFIVVVAAAIYSTIQGVAEHRGLPPVRYLFSGLFVFYAVWLGYLGWVGPEGSWYNDDPMSVAFNRWGAAASALFAGVQLVRERFRTDGAAASAG